MKDPVRLLEDNAAPSELRELLRQVPPTRALDSATRWRMQRRLVRVTALPVTAAVWLTLKTAAAAFGLAAGTTAVGAVVVKGIQSVSRDEPAATVPAVSRTKGHARRAVSEAPPSAASAEPSSPSPVPERQPIRAAAAVSSNGPQPAPASSPTASVAAFPILADAATLGEESELLERARAMLARDPAGALNLVRRHTTRFDRPILGSERMLIEIDALDRLGQEAEARALAQKLLAARGGGLYRERVDRLLGGVDTEP